jgi:hypothetical protein
MKRLISKLLPSLKKSPRPSLAQNRRVRLGFESLERRDLMSASPLATASAHLLAAPATATQPALTLMYNMNTSTTQVDYNIVNFDEYLTWPNNPGFYIQIGNEVMKVTAFGNGVNDFTVQRDCNDVDTSHNVGDAIWLSNGPTLTKLPAPTNFTARAVSSSQVNLAWSPVAGAQQYVIYALGQSGPQQIDTTTSTSFPITSGLRPGTPYSFAVAAQNSTTGIGDMTSWQNATTFPAAPAVPVPLSPSGTATATTVTLTWQAASGAVKYNVRVNDLTTGQYNWATGTVTSTSPTVSGLTFGHSYSWQVQSVGATGLTSAWSATMNFTVASFTPPAAPTGLTATAVSSSTINLSWSAVTRATRYEVYEWNGTVPLLIGSTTSTSYGIPRLQPNATYYFEVAAVNSAGTGNASAWAQALTYPAAPTNFQVQAPSVSSLNIYWSSVAGATGYYVEVYVNGQWKMLGVVQTTGCSINLASCGLTYGVTYEFAVGAHNASGTTFNTVYAAA